jgi:hypothetical protein
MNTRSLCLYQQLYKILRKRKSSRMVKQTIQQGVQTFGFWFYVI